MLSSQSQPVVRPLYNGGRIALQGTHHHLLSMLVDTLTIFSLIIHRGYQMYPLQILIFLQQYLVIFVHIVEGWFSFHAYGGVC